MKTLKLLLLLTISSYLLLLSSCAPVFSTLQSARTVGEGNVEATPSYSTVSFAESGESAKAQDQYGLQIGYGINDDVDFRTRMEHISVDGQDGENVNVTAFEFGPKFSKNNKVAFYIPIGFAVGKEIETSETWQLIPSLIFTLPVDDRLELNPSLRYLITLAEGYDDLIAVNIGAGISTDMSKWMIRPEYGHLYNPNESGHFSQFSIGFTFYH